VEDTIHRGLADGVIISGWATGHPPSATELQEAKEAAGETPVFIGSGANWDNIATLIPPANGVIVSSSLKRQGKIHECIDPVRVSQFVETLQRSLNPQI
jgi:predicted TIM-barrel enzyme